jgi:multimeric flavodoxin WrbA
MLRCSTHAPWEAIRMKIVVFHGSARVGGDTDTLAELFLQGLQTRETHQVEHFRPIDMEIGHCRGATCLRCAEGGGCVLQDDMQRVYPVFSAADIVVMATPMFWGYMTSQLKTLFDRLEAVVSPADFGGKDFVLLIGYRHTYGSMVEWLERIARGFGSRAHALTCRTFDPSTGRDVPVANTPERLREAASMGRKVARLRREGRRLGSESTPWSRPSLKGPPSASSRTIGHPGGEASKRKSNGGRAAGEGIHCDEDPVKTGSSRPSFQAPSPVERRRT